MLEEGGKEKVGLGDVEGVVVPMEAVLVEAWLPNAAKGLAALVLGANEKVGAVVVDGDDEENVVLVGGGGDG